MKRVILVPALVVGLTLGLFSNARAEFVEVSTFDSSPFALDLSGAVDFSGIDARREGDGFSVDGGAGFLGSLKGYYYFHKNVGVFLGVGFTSRPIDFGVEQTFSGYAKPISASIGGSVSWFEVPFGISFKHSFGVIKGILNIGAFAAFPLERWKPERFKLKTPVGSASVKIDADDYLGEDYSAKMRTVFGLNASIAALYPVSDRFFFGITGDIKYGFTNPFKDSGARKIMGRAHTISGSVGLALRAVL